RDQRARPEFVAQQYRVAERIIGQHRDGMAALHEFPFDAVRATAVLPDFEAVAVELQEPFMKRGLVADARGKPLRAHAARLSPRVFSASPGRTHSELLATGLSCCQSLKIRSRHR